jgi:hypothetical protein
MKRLLLALVLPAGLAATSPLPAQEPADAFADAVARELVTRARERRGLVDRSISAYRTLSTERMSVGYRLLRRDRLLFRRETAARVHWQRDSVIDIEVLGAREVVPVARGKVQLPDDLANYVPHIAFDPLDSEFLFRMDTNTVRHPLAAGSERDYRFAAGDSSVIRLPDGRQVRLRELRIIPRRRDPHLIAGSFWIDQASHAVVQAAFRLARPWEIADAADDDDRDDIPGFLRSIRMDLSHFVVDYGLWDLRWWLPRYLTVRGVVEFGRFGTLPMQYERSYTDYEVRADSTVRPVPRDTLRERCRGQYSLTINVGGSDSARIARTREALERRNSPGDTVPSGCSRRYRVTVPDSLETLVASEHLPESIWGDTPMLSERELTELAEVVSELPEVGWQLARPRLDWGLGGTGLARYNRIEALGLGARGAVDLGRAQASLEASYGIADRMPKGKLEAGFSGAARELRLSGYRELKATDAALRPFGLVHSLNALLFGRDDAQYYRALGAALEVAPPSASAQWYALRLYAEQQRPVYRNTHWSVPRLFDGDREFRENILADRATQYGTDLLLRTQYGENPSSLRAGVQADVRAETGTFEFVRPALTAHVALPPVGGLALAVEGAAGTTFETSPVQSHWYLGGTSTLRGYSSGVLAGPAFWRGRAEVATSLPAVRLAVFSDVGWAGAASNDAFRAARPLLSAGVGVSLLDGIARLDLARALRAPTGWRLHLYLDALL